MRFLHVALVASTVAVLSVCDDSPTAPAGALLGQWGGFRAELIATATSVRVNLPCKPGLIARTPLIPDAQGRFVLPLSRPFIARSSTTSALTLRGQVEGATITFDAIAVTPTDGLHDPAFCNSRSACRRS